MINLRRPDRRKKILIFSVVAVAYVMICLWLSGVASENRYMVRAFDSDESGILMVLQKMHADRSWEPMLYNYGTAHTYISLVLIYFLGIFKQITFLDIAYLARAINVVALLGMGWVFLLRGKSREHFKWSVLFLLCLLYGGLNFRYAVNGKPEHLQAFFLVCSIFLFQPFFAELRMRWLLGAGFFAGMAFATKYMGAFLLTFEGLVLLVFFLSQEETRRKPLLLIRWGLTLAVGALAGVVLLGPYLLINYPEVLSTLEFVAYITGRGFLTLDSKHWYDWFLVLFSRDSLWWGLAVWIVPGGLLVLSRILKGKDRHAESYIGFVWGFVYFVYLLACVKVRAPRYLLVFLPFWLDFVFYSLGEIDQWLQTEGRGRLAKALFGVVLCAVLYSAGGSAWSTANSVTTKQNSPRVEAGNWLAENVRHTGLVAYDLYTYVPPEFMRRYHQNYLRVYDVMAKQPDYLVTSMLIMSRYLDPDRAIHYPEGADSFMSHYYLYVQLNADTFPGYRLLKDFGEVRIFEKVSK
jgi:hypothetical protein